MKKPTTIYLVITILILLVLLLPSLGLFGFNTTTSCEVWLVKLIDSQGATIYPSDATPDDVPFSVKKSDGTKLCYTQMSPYNNGAQCNVQTTDGFCPVSSLSFSKELIETEVKISASWKGGISPYIIEFEAGDGEGLYLKNINAKTYNFQYVYSTLGNFQGSLCVYDSDPDTKNMCLPYDILIEEETPDIPECTIPSDCEGLSHIACVGSWSCIANQCFWNCDTIPPEEDEECNYYYWYDDNSVECGYKNFCGEYMYQGLNVFNTLEDCDNSLPEDEDETPDEEDETFFDKYKYVIIVGGVLLLLLLFSGKKKR